jgi:hypothetical protein
MVRRSRADEPSVAHPAVGERPGPEADPRRSDVVAPPARIGLAVLVIALMPFPIVLHGWGNPKLPYDYLTIIFPVDLALAGLLIAGLGPLARRLRSHRLGAGATAWLALALVMTAALLVHPSSRGLHTVFELWAVAVLAATVAETLGGEFAPLVLGALVGLGVVEAVWSGAQLIIGSGLGLESLGEDARPLLPFSPSVSAPMGSMVHPYILAGLALVASSVAAWRALSAPRPAGWLIAAAVCIAPVGFTFSRAGLLSAALIAGAFALIVLRRGPRRRRAAAAVFVLCVGVAIPAAIWNHGWRDRASETTSASTAGQLTTQRTHLIHEAVGLIRAEPATGIGPGQYIPALQRHLKVEGDAQLANFRPVHNVVLIVGAEGGVPALVVAAALFALVGWRALRSGPVAIAIYLAYFPFAMLDHFAYSFPQGLVLTGFWLGVLDAITAPRVDT